MPKKYTNKQFVFKVFNMVKNEYTFKEKYINSKTKILCKHSEPLPPNQKQDLEGASITSHIP